MIERHVLGPPGARHHRGGPYRPRPASSGASPERPRELPLDRLCRAPGRDPRRPAHAGSARPVPAPKTNVIPGEPQAVYAAQACRGPIGRAGSHALSGGERRIARAPAPLAARLTWAGMIDRRQRECGTGPTSPGAARRCSRSRSGSAPAWPANASPSPPRPSGWQSSARPNARAARGRATRLGRIPLLGSTSGLHPV